MPNNNSEDKDLVLQLGIKQDNGTYEMKDIGVEVENVIGLAEEIEKLDSGKSFEGTTAEWDALTAEQQAKYTKKFITDDVTTSTAVMVGATSSTNGAAGLVPMPEAGDEGKLLRGDGEWVDMANDTSVIAPTEVSPSENTYAVGDQLFYEEVLYTVTAPIDIGDSLFAGTNIQASDNLTTQMKDMSGAGASTNGRRGMVPKPYAGDQNKVLKGDGAWGYDNRNNVTNLAPEYDPTLTYAVDDLVTFIDDQGSGKLYKCIVAIESPEAFNINKWDDVTTSEVFEKKSEILASVTADGTKTLKDIFDELYNTIASVDLNKLLHSEIICETSNSFIKFICVKISPSEITYERTIATASNQTLQVIYIQLSTNSAQNVLNYYNLSTTPTPDLRDQSSNVETAGVVWYIKTL